MSKSHRVLPPLPEGFNFPFYYASLDGLWLYYLVDPSKVLPHLENTGLNPALFEEQALVNINFQRYTSHLSTVLSTVDEVEFNLVSYPAALEQDVPHLTVDDYLSGQEQTKLIGNYRLHVAADNEHAVEAGIKAFGEPKFYTTFTYAVPDLNDPTVTTWNIKCNDPVDSSQFIFQALVNTQKLGPGRYNLSPITGYTLLNKRLLGTRWNLYGVYSSATRVSPELVELSFGQSLNPMRLDMQQIIGSTHAYAIQRLVSPPVATEGRGYYVNPEART
jgi:hypothetical protein